jgi:photosystem II stability/assembly factor-like uncharacterized protein
MSKKTEINWLTGPVAGPGVTRDGAIGKDGVIVLSGDEGTIYRSPDGGKSWQVINSKLGDWFHLFGVATDGKGRFVATGRGRVIVASTDNGLSWAQVQQKNGDRSIYKAAFGKNNLVIAADEEIGYHVSKDGGLNWTHNQDKKMKALRAIEFLADTFYAGSPSAAWRSVDGIAWNHVNTQSNGARAFAYNDKTNTLFAGGHAVSRSSDDGKTWEQVFDLAPVYGEDANIMGITCFDDVVICTGGDMLTLVSRDNGATWGQLGQYPVKGGFLGLLQTAERVIGIGTFTKEDAPVCFLEKTAIMEAITTPPNPIPTPTPNPTPPPPPTPTPTPTPTPMDQFMAAEYDRIAEIFSRLANALRAQPLP